MSAVLDKPAGTTPEGIHTEQEAARWVRSMFERVAPRYDLANHLLSLNVDRYWRNRTVAGIRDVLRRPHTRVLDLACGTGDLLIAMERDAGRALFGSDFCHPMLTGAREKLARGRLRSCLLESDAMHLPFPDASLDLITIAFGYRNFANYRGGLVELRRVLRPGGALAILEFTQPPNKPFAAFYNWYSRKVLPVLGGAISGAPEAYAYLPESVRKFPDAPELACIMRECGFASVDWEYLTFGIAALHIGRV
ncbi:MAG TPA: bifunctional demethylmenaquinone methyltransferase/2-methoxy-6-polyprenyl-1,4-benzoquinol methylase UbiE [Bryobacteraceae bacterium]|jgi:demethylmenaquinone methyltransferase/2-methoxy-6-polyprenyl-1,4-benzoquinol methylase|nr:bifunctional demethylmenaquinone methyltransferase/2-methoxy-6-polyprenyl-1,4-benzoquinol methylase UbiE [Bryobacteraceae bacterium]